MPSGEKPGTRGMTVAQLIERLKRMPDKDMMILLDCPHCGKSAQLWRLSEVVVAEGREA